MRISRLLLTVSLTAFMTAFIAGCAVGPDFEKPAAPDVSSYDSTPLADKTEASENDAGTAQEFKLSQDIPAAWWTLFHSEPLNQLIKNAIKSNPDLTGAQAALRIAQENVYAGEGALFPTVSGSFSSTRQKVPGASYGGDFPSTIYTLHNASVNVSYNIDVFGGVRRQLEELSAAADYERFQLEATYLSLTSNIVTTAIQEASLRGQIAATQKIIDDQTHGLDLVKQQFELGGAPKSVVLLQEASLQQTKATLPSLKKQLAITRHQLSVLGGDFPNKDPKATFDLTTLKLPEELPVSLPSNLVIQRPDVRAAESNLHAASAAIGVAVSNRLPQFAINADIGTVANTIGKLFTPGSGIWAFGGQATQTLFDAGTLMHEQRAAEAQYDLEAAQYRATVLAAFQDVADTLHALQSDAETLKAQTDAERAASDSLRLTEAQYEAGAINYLNLLTAEQTEQNAKILLVQAEAQRFSDTAALFQALGGGWWNRVENIEQDASAHDTTEVANTETASTVHTGE